MQIDSHQHFWNYNEVEYPWIPKGSPLQRDWLPGDLQPLLTRTGLDGSIAVQARQTLDESRWLLALAQRHALIKGVVGWVDLRAEDLDQQLAGLSQNSKLVGVRHVVQDEPDMNFMLGAAFQRGIGRLKQYALTYDILIYPKQLPAAIELVRRFPEQPFVLDHIAEWIRELAGFPHVGCKVSGLVTESDPANWKPADFKPYLDIVFEAFGEDRLMYGSDWPVCLLGGSYDKVFGLIDDYSCQLKPGARDKLFGGNAARFYRIE